MHPHRYNKIAQRRIRVEGWNADGGVYYDQTDTVDNFQTLDPLNPVLSDEDLERIYKLAKGDTVEYTISLGVGGNTCNASLTRI